MIQPLTFESSGGTPDCDKGFSSVTYVDVPRHRSLAFVVRLADFAAPVVRHPLAGVELEYLRREADDVHVTVGQRARSMFDHETMHEVAVKIPAERRRPAPAHTTAG